ncbi:hypothetical protein FSP39_000174, partial [Pinctada imbricata]
IFVNNSVSLSYILGFLNKKAKLSIIGLDNAGKSTLMSLLADGKLVQHPPTPRPVSREMTLGGVTFTTYDLGGHTHARRLWKDYFPAINGVVFVVDAADAERLAEAKVELTAVLEDDLISDIPVLILGNKTDKRESIGMENLIQQLDIRRHLTKMNDGLYSYNKEDKYHRKGECKLFMCSMLKREGYGDAFRWLANQIP